MRPLSILSVEDQIAYQAAVNVIADRLYRRVRKRYYHEVFGHLYAGKSSIWFYRKWQKGYAEFNKAAREASVSKDFSRQIRVRYQSDPKPTGR